MTTKLTFMQKLLGKNYKWWYLYLFTLKRRLSSLPDSLVFSLGHGIIIAGNLTVWWLSNNKQIDLTLSSKFSYFLIGELYFATFLIFNSFYGFYILRGSHTTKLLLPQSFFKLIMFQYIGEAAIQNVSKIVFITISIILMNSILSFSSIEQLGLLGLFTPISFSILFLIEFLVSMSAFFLTMINGIILNFNYLAVLLAGRLFPLNLLISDFKTNLLNPFAFTFYHPMQIYLGKYDFNQTILVFAGGISWCIILYFLAKWIFKLGLKRNEAVGL